MFLIVYNLLICLPLDDQTLIIFRIMIFCFVVRFIFLIFITSSFFPLLKSLCFLFLCYSHYCLGEASVEFGLVLSFKFYMQIVTACRV